MSRRKKRARRKNRRADWIGSTRRSVILVVASLTIPAGLLFSVRRTAEGTRMAEQLAELRRETRLLEEALVEEVMRVDSLSSRERIGRAAEQLGFRQAEDDEVVILGDVSFNVDGERP